MGTDCFTSTKGLIPRLPFELPPWVDLLIPQLCAKCLPPVFIAGWILSRLARSGGGGGGSGGGSSPQGAGTLSSNAKKKAQEEANALAKRALADFNRRPTSTPEFDKHSWETIRDSIAWEFPELPCEGWHRLFSAMVAGVLDLKRAREIAAESVSPPEQEATPISTHVRRRSTKRN